MGERPLAIAVAIAPSRVRAACLVRVSRLLVCMLLLLVCVSAEEKKLLLPAVCHERFPSLAEGEACQVWSVGSPMF